MTVPAMLHSSNTTVSAPAITAFRGSITHPTQQLCTLRGRRYLRLTQHSPPGDSLRLTWAGLPPADRASLLAPSVLRRQASPENLDRLLTVTTPVGWLALAGILLLLGLVVAWSILGRLPAIVGG